MSGATQGATSGAVSGAVSGASVGGVPGAVVGGVIGGVSGYLGGSGADKRKAKEKAAQRRLAIAMARYGGRTQQVSDYVVGQSHGIEDQYRAALEAHLAGQPDQAALLPGRVNAERTALSGAAQPAFQPMVGHDGGENAYLRGVQADTQRRYSDAANPLAVQGGAARSGMADADYQRQLATQLSGYGVQTRNLGTLQQLQQAQDYENYAKAQAKYGVQRAQAQSAGSDQILYGQLLQAGGTGVAGAFMGSGRSPTAGQIVSNPNYVNPQNGTSGGYTTYGGR